MISIENDCNRLVDLVQLAEEVKCCLIRVFQARRKNVNRTMLIVRCVIGNRRLEDVFRFILVAVRHVVLHSDDLQKFWILLILDQIQNILIGGGITHIW